MYASREVMRLFNGIERIHLQYTVFRDRDQPAESTLILARVALAGAVEDLQAAIRKEMGSDQIRLHTGDH